MRLKVESFPVPKAYTHPPPPNEILPRHEFTMGLIAPKGSGKTTLICNLLKFYKGYFHNIIVFSPTVASDEKWDLVKTWDLLSDNKPLKNYVRSLRDRKVDGIVERAHNASELEQLVPLDPLDDKRIPESMFFDDYDEETLRDIVTEQKKIVTILNDHGKPKHLANR